LRDFERAGEEFRAERFLNVVAGTETLRGYGGERLKRELQRCVAAASDHLEILDPKERRLTLIEAIAPVIKRTRLEANEQGISYCSFGDPKTDAAHAKCLQVAAEDGIRGGKEPDPAYASAPVCGACIFGCHFKETESVLDVLIRKVQQSFDSSRSLSVREYEARRLEVLKGQRELRQAQERSL
jgi:hypothetical protein